MADIDSLIDSIDRLTMNMSRTTTGQGSISAQNDPNKAAGILSTAMGSATKSLVDFEGSTSSASTTVNKMSDSMNKIPFVGVALAATGVGAAFGMLAGVAQNLYDNWVELYQVGAVDGMTGLTTIGKIATESYQSMSDFTDAVRNSSKVVAELGLQGFSNLQTDVRIAAREFGSFGMNIREQNEALGEFLEVQRTLGSIENLNRGQAISDFINLSLATSALAQATGRSRDQIAKQTADNMKNNTSLYGFLNTLPDGIKQSVTASAQGAMNIFASLGEQTGGDLNKILSGTLATGSAALAGGLAEIQAFIPGVVRGFDGLQSAVRSGDIEAAQQGAIAVVEELKSMGPAQAQQLAMLAERGNQAAQQILAMTQNVETFNADQLRRSIRDREQFTSTNQFFGNFTQNLNMITSQLRRIFFTILEPIMESFGSSKTDAFSNFATSLDEFVTDKIIPAATNLGNWLANTGIPETIESIRNWSNGLFDNVPGEGLGERFSTWINGIFSSSEGKAATGILDGLGNMFGKMFKTIGEFFLGVEDKANIEIGKVGGLFADIFGQERWNNIKQFINGVIDGISETFMSIKNLSTDDIKNMTKDFINDITNTLKFLGKIPESIDSLISSMWFGETIFGEEIVDKAKERIAARKKANEAIKKAEVDAIPNANPSIEAIEKSRAGGLQASFKEGTSIFEKMSGAQRQIKGVGNTDLSESLKKMITELSEDKKIDDVEKKQFSNYLQENGATTKEMANLLKILIGATDRGTSTTNSTFEEMTRVVNRSSNN